MQDKTVTTLTDFQLTRHRAELAKRYRGWELTKLPGYELNGSRRFAFVAMRRAKIYYQFVLDYDELDWVSERREGPAAEFFRALYQIPSTDTLLHFHGSGERRSPGCLPRDGSVHALWQKHQAALPDHAQLNHGGWRWWRGKGLTLEFCEELKRLVIDRYKEAQTALAPTPHRTPTL
jgi:hypothetical protein